MNGSRGTDEQVVQTTKVVDGSNAVDHGSRSVSEARLEDPLDGVALGSKACARCAAGLATSFASGLTSGLATGFASGLATGLASGFASGLASGFADRDAPLLRFLLVDRDERHVKLLLHSQNLVVELAVARP